MAGKLFFLALLATLVLVNVHGDDDFKEVDNVEEIENMEQEVEDDEESEVRQPRKFGFGRRVGRFGGSRTGSRFGSWRSSRTSTSKGGLFRFRKSGTRTGGFRFGRKTTGNRGGFRFGKRTPGGSTGRGGFRFRKTRQTGGGGAGGGVGGWQKLGTVLSLAQLGTDIAQITLTTMSNVERKIVISLGNVAGAPWEGGTVYMQQGSLIKVLPPQVPVEEGVLMGGVKKSGPSATGVSGAFCYNFEGSVESFCLMFKLPWSGDNYWNLKVYPKQTQASESVYNDLQKGAIKAGEPITKKDLATGDGYKFFMKDCSMTNSAQANLQLSLGIENVE